MTQRIEEPWCDHVAVQNNMDMICTHCGIILALLDRPSHRGHTHEAVESGVYCCEQDIWLEGGPEKES